MPHLILNPKPRIDAVALDMDGVVIKSTYDNPLARNYQPAGFGEFSHQQFAERLALAAMGGDVDAVDWRAYRNQGPAKIWRETQGGPNPELEEAFRATSANMLADIIRAGGGSFGIAAGLKEFIDHNNGRTQPLPLALVTNNDRVVLNAVIQTYGLEDVFAATVAHREAGQNKPQPHPYYRAAHLLGVRSLNMLGVEDTARGVQALAHAGAFSVGITGVHTLDEIDAFAVTADATIEHLSELPILLEA